MLNLTTALGRNGLQDWLLQRVTALFLGIYVAFMLAFWFFNGAYDPIHWQILFNIDIVCYATVVALIALMVHAWVGIWVVLTDYVKAVSLRIILLIAVYCWLLFDLIWCVQILWGY